MTYIPDLAAISYLRLPGNIRAIGWLEAPHSFVRGPVEPEFIQRLLELIECPLIATASFGVYECSFCEAEAKRGPQGTSSQDELLVPAADCIYETPIWIGHYVLDHAYQPPQEFRHAVLSSPRAGSDEFLQALRAHLPAGCMDAIGGPGHQVLSSFNVQRTLQPYSEHCSQEDKPRPPRWAELRQRYLRFYDSLGPEDKSQPCQAKGCERGAIRHSIFCRRHHFEQIQLRACPFDH